MSASRASVLCRPLRNRYFVVRHGESEANAQGIIVSGDQGLTGYGLTSRGSAMADVAGWNLRARRGKVSSKALLFASDFKRARETAERIGAVIGATPVLDKRLRERYFGDFDMKSNDNYKPVWEEDKKSAVHTFSNVESLTSVSQRVMSLVDELEGSNDGADIILVSHGDTLSILVASCLVDFPLTSHRHIDLGVAEVLELKYALPKPPNYNVNNRANPMITVGKLVSQFSTEGTKPGVHRLITIGISHFCEKGRWALDLSGIDYTEDAHPPGFHVPPVLRVSNFTTTSTPTLVCPDGKVFSDSTKILEYLAETVPALKSLYPTPDVKGWEDYFDTVLGPQLRVVVYSHVLGMKDLCVRLMTLVGPKIERVLFPRMQPMVASAIGRGLSVNAISGERALADVRQVFAQVSESLSDGRPYICGQTFTAADLTFASLAYPLLDLPSARNLSLPLSEFPEKLKNVANELRASPAGQHALRMYKQHRPLNSTGDIHINSFVANRLPPALGIGLTAIVAYFAYRSLL